MQNVPSDATAQSISPHISVGRHLPAASQVEALTDRDPRALLTSGDVMKILGVCNATLSNWRCRGTGPAYIRLSRSRVAYQVADVLSFIASKRVAA